MAARLTKTQRQKLKQLIIVAEIHRYTETETLQFIRESLGYDISRETLYEIKRENKKDAISWLSKMRGNKKYSYIAEFKRQIDKFEMYEAMFFHLYDTTKSESLKFKC